MVRISDHQAILDRLLVLTAEAAGRPVPADGPLMENGLTSNQLVTLLARAGEEWAVEIPTEVLFERGNLRGIAEYLAARRRGQKTQDPPDDGVTGIPATMDRRAMRARIRQMIEESHA
jgi:hypothetical protein